jgi:hypothetical protein
MKRNDMVESMVEFYESIPDGASSYHKMDMLLSRLERSGMLPPEAADFNIGNNWGLEDKWTVEYESSEIPYGKVISDRINVELLKMRDTMVSECYDILKVYKEPDGTLTVEKMLTAKKN